MAQSRPTPSSLRSGHGNDRGRWEALTSSHSCLSHPLVRPACGCCLVLRSMPTDSAPSWYDLCWPCLSTVDSCGLGRWPPIDSIGGPCPPNDCDTPGVSLSLQSLSLTHLAPDTVHPHG